MSTVNNVVKILVSFPFVVENTAGSVGAVRNVSLPKIGFPFVATIGEHNAFDAIAQ